MIILTYFSKGIELENYKSKIKFYLNEFKKFEEKFGNGIPNSITLDYKKHGAHIVYSGIIHGNEVGSLPAMIKFINDIVSKKIIYNGKISFVLGNTEASQKNVRYIDSDLNRNFGDNFFRNNDKERKRALEIMAILKTADVYFDFHQTIMPCVKPFYIFEIHDDSYYWARAVGGATILITRRKGKSFSNLGLCSDEYVRSLGKVGVTIELGEKGFSEETNKLTYHIMKKSLLIMKRIYEKKYCIKELSRKNNELNFLSVVHREKFSNPKIKLNKGIINFQKITKGMILGVNEHNLPIIAAKSGFILFPKYPIRNENEEAILPLPGEIFVIADYVKNHPLKW